MYIEKSSIEYINELKFDYFETYSFQRGTEFEFLQEKLETEFEVLENRFNLLTNEELERFNELEKLVNFTQYILDSNHKFHYSAVKKNTFDVKSVQAEELIIILQTTINEISDWMCAPMYRDAIIFYNKEHKIVSSLNICLSCEWIEIYHGNQILADVKTYEKLRHFFIHIGHDVETE